LDFYVDELDVSPVVFAFNIFGSFRQVKMMNIVCGLIWYISGIRHKCLFLLAVDRRVQLTATGDSKLSKLKQLRSP
jgi:hypothetical protein